MQDTCAGTDLWHCLISWSSDDALEGCTCPFGPLSYQPSPCRWWPELLHGPGVPGGQLYPTPAPAGTDRLCNSGSWFNLFWYPLRWHMSQGLRSNLPLDERGLRRRLKWWAMVFYKGISVLEDNKHTWVALLTYNKVWNKTWLFQFSAVDIKEGRGFGNKSGLLKSWPWPNIN